MATHKAKATRKANNQVHKKYAKRVHSKKTKKAMRKSHKATSKSHKAMHKSHKATRKSRRHKKGGNEARREVASVTKGPITDSTTREVHDITTVSSSIGRAGRSIGHAFSSIF